jgi:hypothetical protein
MATGPLCIKRGGPADADCAITISDNPIQKLYVLNKDIAI